MTFYSGIRDDTVAPLLAQFGAAATFKRPTGTYDVATGANSNADDVSFTVSQIELPKRREGSNQPQEFSAEQLAMFSALYLVGAKEFAENSEEPGVNDLLVVNGVTQYILAVKRIAPAGIAVAYKIGVTGKRP